MQKFYAKGNYSDNYHHNIEITETRYHVGAIKHIQKCKHIIGLSVPIDPTMAVRNLRKMTNTKKKTHHQYNYEHIQD